MQAISNALSGLYASSKALEVSATNIANAQSTKTVKDGEVTNTPYVPQQVVQTSQQSGGVSTSLRDVAPPSIQVYAPDDVAADADGIVNLPNVDVASEMINQIQAKNAYMANLSVIKRQDEMEKSLTNIIS